MVEVSPQAVAYAVAETVKSGVKAIVTESMFPDLREGNARFYYFGRTQGKSLTSAKQDSLTHSRRRRATSRRWGTSGLSPPESELIIP
jgi:hypothetical protein